MEEQIIIMPFFVGVLLIIFLVITTIDAIKNYKINKELESLPEWEDSNTCDDCNGPIWPPNRFITSGLLNPFCRLKWEIAKVGCHACDYSYEVKVEVE